MTTPSSNPSSLRDDCNRLRLALFATFRPLVASAAAMLAKDHPARAQLARLEELERRRAELPDLRARRQKALLTWRSHRMRRGEGASWPSFEAFLDEVGVPPSLGARLVNLAGSRKAGPGNAVWSSADDAAASGEGAAVVAAQGDETHLWLVEAAEAGPGSFDETAAVASVVRARRGREHLVSFGGKTLTWSQWALELGLSASTLRMRLKHGLPLSEVLSADRRPSGRKRQAAPQASPKKSSRERLLTFAGETYSLTEWARRKGIPLPTLAGRLRADWSIEEALGEKSRARGIGRRTPRVKAGGLGEPTGSASGGVHPRGKLFTHDGKTLSIAAWARETGISYVTLRQRLARGLTIAEALAPGRDAGWRIRRGTKAERSVTSPAASSSPSSCLENLGIEKTVVPVLKREPVKLPRPRRRLTHEGETLTVSEWARRTGIPVATLLGRIRRGWPTRLILLTPPRPRDTAPREAKTEEKAGAALPEAVSSRPTRKVIRRRPGARVAMEAASAVS